LIRIAFLLLTTLPLTVLAGCSDPSGNARPAALEIDSGDEQQALIFTAVPEPLRVRVTDRNGLPVTGVRVRWSASAGSLTPTESMTGASGRAETTWQFGTVPGVFTAGTHHVTARVTDLPPVRFTGHARAGMVVQSVAFTPTAVDVGTAAALVAVSVRATDDYGSLNDVAVRFTSASGAQSAGYELLSLASGTVKDGVWEGTVAIPHGAESGVWTLSGVRMRGSTGSLVEGATTLQQRGMPYQLTVTGGS
jgi:hypothetical protein